MTAEKRCFVKKYVLITAVAALLLMLLVLVRWRGDARIDSIDARIAYLSALGWRCDPESEQVREIALPEVFDGVMADYESMQEENGYDMSRYAGKTCTQYIYTLTEHPGSLTVYAVLYIYNGRVIGGDIHTAVLDGYMHGLRTSR